MKGYLLLDDGSIFMVNTQGKENFLGEITSIKEDYIKMQCTKTGNYKLIVNSKGAQYNHIELTDYDFDLIVSKLQNSKTRLAKIVVDSLSLEFHLYDLKTFIPIT